MEDNVVKLNTSTSKEIVEEVVSSSDVLKDKEAAEKIFELQEMLKETTQLDIPEEVLIQIITLLGLPDDKFKVISNEFLDYFEKSLNNPSEKIAISQMIVSSGYKFEDLIQLQKDWGKLIDTGLGIDISENKKAFLKQVFAVVINSLMDNNGISKRIITIPIEINDDAKIPTYAHVTDAGADVYAAEDITLNPGEIKIIKTGIKVQIPRGYEIQIRPRSGLSAKSKLRIANAPGTIDSGYRDEIGIICENIESKIKDIDVSYNDDGTIKVNSIEFGTSITIEKGERIAQLVLSEVPTINFTKVDEISNEDDREGGFGSTGV